MLNVLTLVTNQKMNLMTLVIPLIISATSVVVGYILVVTYRGQFHLDL